jgi:hypothetical protein
LLQAPPTHDLATTLAGKRKRTKRTKRRASSASFLDRHGIESELAFNGPPAPLRAIGDPDPGPAVGCYVFRLAGGAKAFAKGNTADHPHRCINEWVGSSMGLLSGFSLLPIGQLDWNGTIYVAWPYLEPTELESGVIDWDTPALRGCANAASLVYQAVALDALLANPDRHNRGNVLVVRGRNDLMASSPMAFLNDHERGCLNVGPAGIARAQFLTGDWIDGWIQHQTAWLRSDAKWNEGIVQPTSLDSAVTTLQAVGRDKLRAVVRMAPPGWCNSSARGVLNRFLSARRQHLSAIVQSRLALFPNLISP